jgi:lipid A 3-O-deacylase
MVRFFASGVGTVAAAAMALLWLVPAMAQDKDPDGIFTAQFENDLFSAKDGHFTHGTRFAWMAPEDDVPDAVLSAAEKFPLFEQRAARRLVWSLGQNIYTPDDISVHDPDPNDRPYAGWTYIGLGLVSVDENWLDNLELNIGVVGPASGGAATQRQWHKWFGFQEPKGWDHQLKNEPGIVLLYDSKWRNWTRVDLLGLEFDATPNAGLALGNVFTHVQAGMEVRLGRDLPSDYGAPRIRPSLPGADYFRPEKSWGWYVFAGFTGRAVARNIFLDGNTFTDSRSVDKRPFVGDFQLGFAMTFSAVRLAYTHIYRTREFEHQAEADEFGSLSLSVRF